jgi:hypothetical protein
LVSKRVGLVLTVACQRLRAVQVDPGLTPDFLHATLDRAAYAAFFTESRTRLLGSTNLHRKSGCVLSDSQSSPFDKLRAGSAGLISLGM